MSRRALHTEAPSGCILCLGDINFVLLALRLCLIGPGIDAAEFVDVGVAQFGQRGGCGLAAVSAAAVDQHGGILFGNYLSGSILVKIAE